MPSLRFLVRQASFKNIFSPFLSFIVIIVSFDDGELESILLDDKQRNDFFLPVHKMILKALCELFVIIPLTLIRV